MITPVGFPVGNRFRQRFSHSLPKMPALRITSDQKDDLNTGQLVQYPLSPDIRTTLHGWKVSAFGIIARKAESHGKDGKLRCIVEFIPADTHPITQTVARWIVERCAGRICEISWCLTGDQDLRVLRQLEYRIGRPGHFRLTQSALPHFPNQ